MFLFKSTKNLTQDDERCIVMINSKHIRLNSLLYFVYMYVVTIFEKIDINIIIWILHRHFTDILQIYVKNN